MRRKQRNTSKLIPLDERFEMDRAFRSERLLRASKLCTAIDREDGEAYLIWLIEKTGVAVDNDIARFLRDTVRRVRGVLARHAAREVLLEVVDLVEDDHEIGIRFVGADGTLASLPFRHRNRIEAEARMLLGRVWIWRQIARLAQGLGYLHAADIVHGGVADNTVFTYSLDPLELKLGGYEGSIHVGTLGEGGAGLLRPGAVISYAQDWRDLGRVAARLLLQREENGAVLLPSEQRLLGRLCSPPQFAHVDGEALAVEIETLCSELERIGSSGRYELVAMPSRDLLRRDAPALTQGLLQASDAEALLAFLQDDLMAEAPRMWRDPRSREGVVQLFTQRGIYDIRPLADEPRIGRVMACRPRGAGEGEIKAVPLTPRIHLSRDPHTAQDYVARAGGGAMSWVSAGEAKTGAVPSDPVEWRALILIEIVALLERRLRQYPVELVDHPGKGLLSLTAREDADLDAWRARLGLNEAAAALHREMDYNDDLALWTLTPNKGVAVGTGAPSLTLEDVVDDQKGRRLYVFRQALETPQLGRNMILCPRPDAGEEAPIRRRLRHVVTARGNVDLLRALGDPRSVGLDPALLAMAPPGEAPVGFDLSKQEAWERIRHGHSLDLVIGPPGVGKTFLVSRLVAAILSETPAARILISAQNHESLADMERILRKHLADKANDALVVRVERTERGGRTAREPSETRLRTEARDILRSLARAKATPLSQVRRRIILGVLDKAEAKVAPDPEGEGVLRDTEHLLLRSADVTLATANSFTVEEMVSEGQQFDWVIIEEAARASGSELVGPLLLGARRVLIGDHRQLAPFDAARKERLYRGESFDALLEGARKMLKAMSDLPEEIEEMLALLECKPELRADVLATALRLEQPFREIAERAENESAMESGGPVSMLTEQSRMQPAICGLVSDVFYGGRLTTAERILNDPCPILADDPALAAPVVLLDFPPLSKTVTAFETREKQSPSLANRLEIEAVMEALDLLKPIEGKKPTLAILSPYTAQCRLLEARLAPLIDPATGTLKGFFTAKSGAAFVHTIDSFQGSEADLVVVSAVRNNQDNGRRALGILGDRRRMNVLLSRARHKLILVTSSRFLRNAIQIYGEGASEFEFLATLLNKIDSMTRLQSAGLLPQASIILCDKNGKLLR